MATGHRGRVQAQEVRHLRLADRPGRRRHQDPQVTPHAGAAEAGGPSPQTAPHPPRHSFVSIMSDQGVPIETIADLVGHAGTSVTEAVYRHQLRPMITKGARTMNIIFGEKPTGWLPSTPRHERRGFG
ncbi:tyrosine-type recombinase/integrase [Nonomuraea sp. NPDC004702]